jgi:hypothetical protein
MDQQSTGMFLCPKIRMPQASNAGPPHDPPSPPAQDPPNKPLHDPAGDPAYQSRENLDACLRLKKASSLK